ncbi:dephospho-CoA kinase [Mycetocola tolaasinivorans]|uniref:Dephospho-CoA kinase n=1 Tax=Mycetocola tolaasinivorans TaxID=76635 RepID=A0A3L7A206_9MICO|nr:dephospho-CoA kinase [Mycetocola tolaasinivorans]RLP74259.1 dephospho-CoA kinase [Mycetocola tolaasinivorans]
MYLIGLTGGIASGKSTIAKRLKKRGAVHLDADRLAREVVEPGEPALERIRARFGDAVIAEDGSLNRPALGAIVFTDPAALADLNGIVHPAVQARTRALFAAAEAENPNAVVVYDVPLLVEAKLPYEFDAVVVAEAPAEVRIERMVRLRQMERAEAERRIGAQATDAERRAVATHLIDTGGTLLDTLATVDAFADTVPGLDTRA